MPRTSKQEEIKIPASPQALMREIRKCTKQIEEARQVYKRFNALSSAAIEMFLQKGKPNKKLPEVKRLKIGAKYFVMRPKYLNKENERNNAIFKSIGTSVFEFLTDKEYREKYQKKVR